LTSTWPYNLGDLYYNLQASDYSDSAYSFIGDALMERVSAENRTDEPVVSAHACVGTDSKPIRTFYSFSRDNVETGVQATLLKDHYVVNVNTTYVGHPTDTNNFRLDGSYAGVSYWNWTLAIDDVERWWGPGWEGSLILSNNARPFPAISLSRNISKPFDLPVLRWLGNWTLTTFMGELVDDNLQNPPNPYIWGMRVELRPFNWLTIGLTRVAQWGGRGRRRSLSEWWYAFVSKDNSGASIEGYREPGNQLAGYDVRIKPIKAAPVVLYGQIIGEDEDGYLPSALMFLGGMETWGHFPLIEDSTWRLHAEYVDTCARYNLDSPPDKIYGSAYNHHIFKDGYRYKDLCLGDSIDGDGTSLSFGGLICESNGRYWGILLRHMNINRYDDPDTYWGGDSYKNVHTVCRAHAYVDSVETYGGFTISGNWAFQWALAYMDRNHARIEGVKSDVQFSSGVTYNF
jgi:hypothetical protein